MNIFWIKGYDGASLKDLTSAMGINGPSLYATFGDKKALYLRTIDSYVSNDACAPLVAFEQAETIANAVSAFLTATVDYASEGENGNRGCYLSSCVVTNALEMTEVSERLQKAVAETDARLSIRFDTEISKGNLPPEFPSLERARMMFDLRQGIVFRARAGVAKDDLLSGLDHKVSSVLAYKLIGSGS